MPTLRYLVLYPILPFASVFLVAHLTGIGIWAAWVVIAVALMLKICDIHRCVRRHRDTEGQSVSEGGLWVHLPNEPIDSGIIDRMYDDTDCTMDEWNAKVDRLLAECGLVDGGVERKKRRD